MDLSQESAMTLESYGINEPKPDWHPLALGPSTFGKQCLIARRLVERGVRFIRFTRVAEMPAGKIHGTVTMVSKRI